MTLRTIALLTVLSIATLAAQGPPRGGHHFRKHTATEAKPIKLVPATEDPPAETRVEIDEDARFRVIESNGIPDHLVGAFPNRGNPHEITEQRQSVRIPRDPKPAAKITYIHESRGTPQVFGVTRDGVFIEPGTAEVWNGDPNSGWRYEALGGAVGLGLDANHAHVQPTGMYHYHGIPTGLLDRLGDHGHLHHSPLIGWAADGFPIYVLHGYEDPKDAESAIVEFTSSWKLKKGTRSGPGGLHDGTFVEDYEYVAGSGTLDECNGRFCVTPEYPEGTYAYFMTRDWPVVPRAFRGEPVDLKPRGGPGPGGPGGPGGEKGPKGGKGGKGGPPRF